MLEAESPSLMARAKKVVLGFARAVSRLVGTLFVIGFSLLPLSALLIALPAVSPTEAVLTDTVKPARARWRRAARRLLAAGGGAVVLVALIAFAVEVVARLPLPAGGQMSALAKKVLSYSVADFPFVSSFAFPEDRKPADREPLKGALARRDNASKELIEPGLSAARQVELQAEVAAANAEIADWAETGGYEWIVDPKLRAARAARPATPGDTQRVQLEDEIATRVSDVTKRWLPAADLKMQRDTLKKAAARTNLAVEAKREALASLAETETEIAARTPNSRRLQLLQNPALAPVLAAPLWTLLPPALIDHWPFVLLIVYGTDLGLLLLIGKVPLAYNFRYLWVRRRDTALTAVAFTVVVALVVILLAFVNGMYKLNETTGVPGNVLVMSEGSTDELFSNLSRGGEVNNAVNTTVYADAKGRPIGPGGKGVNLARVVKNADGSLTRLPPGTPKDRPGTDALMSYEAYLVMNQPVATKPGEPSRRRFLQLRAFLDVRHGALIHNIDLEPGGRWFENNSVESGEKAPDGLQYLQCCIGEGAAATLGEDARKTRLAVGDTFELGDRWWKVIGLMKTRGTTYGSEIWTGSQNPVVSAAGKGDKYTTLVLRMEDDSDESAKAMAYYLTEVQGGDQGGAKLKAFAEPDYYKELTKTNEQFLTAIVLMAVIMAVGGIFGVMNTMFASIAARIKEVGVLRILGFKRWQILISFMIESLTIAFAGGLLGCLIGSLAHGFEAASTLSGGQGGGKSVTLAMNVDVTILATGLLFTLVMGRLGGLVPALSAMRMEILDSLK
jgi:ABC-type antimicrobial peptide transport system permease subunit